MDTTLAVVLIILGFLIALVLGYFIARFLSWRQAKRLDKHIKTPEIMDKLIYDQLEQEKANERSVNEYDRRKQQLRDTIRRERSPQKTNSELSDQRNNERRSIISRATVDRDPQPEEGVEESDRDIREDKQEPDWAW